MGRTSPKDYKVLTRGHSGNPESLDLKSQERIQDYWKEGSYITRRPEGPEVLT